MRERLSAHDAHQVVQKVCVLWSGAEGTRENSAASFLATASLCKANVYSRIGSLRYQMHLLLVHNYYQQPGGEDDVFARERVLLEAHGHRTTVYVRRNDEIHQYS